MNGPSAELTDLINVALGDAIDSLVPEGGPLMPFAVIDDSSGTRIHRFVTETLEQGLEVARDHVRGQHSCQRAAIVWDGYLTTERGRMDAILVEAYEPREERSVIVAQCYAQQQGVSRSTELVDNAMHVGFGEPLF